MTEMNKQGRISFNNDGTTARRTTVRRCGSSARFITYLSRKLPSQYGGAPQLRYKDNNKLVITDILHNIVKLVVIKDYECVRCLTLISMP